MSLLEVDVEFHRDLQALYILLNDFGDMEISDYDLQNQDSDDENHQAYEQENQRRRGFSHNGISASIYDEVVMMRFVLALLIHVIEVRMLQMIPF